MVQKQCNNHYIKQALNNDNKNHNLFSEVLKCHFIQNGDKLLKKRETQNPISNLSPPVLHLLYLNSLVVYGLSFNGHSRVSSLKGRAMIYNLQKQTHTFLLYRTAPKNTKVIKHVLLFTHQGSFGRRTYATGCLCLFFVSSMTLQWRWARVGWESPQRRRRKGYAA